MKPSKRSFRPAGQALGMHKPAAQRSPALASTVLEIIGALVLLTGAGWAQADTLRPTLTIANPTPGARVTNALFSATGTARDNLQVSAVWFKLNNEAWAVASGTTTWATPELALEPGSNFLSAYAVDISGKFSSTSSVSFVCVQTDALVVQIQGQGKVTPNLNGRRLELEKQYFMTARPDTGFRFKNWSDGSGGVLTNGRTIQFVMKPDLVLVASFVDVARPTLAVTLPKASQRTSNAVFTATGRASDNAGVGQVWCRLNSDAWVQAAGTTNWSQAVTLAPGTNVFQAYAVDLSGNRSATNSLRLFYVPYAPLTVTIVGPGTVTPDYNNQLLQIGKAYSLTARPAKGATFGGWTGSWATSNASFTFTMAPNMGFTATFLDTSRPVNVITYPAVNATLTNAVITATGKATDNVGVGYVWYRFNDSGWIPASTTNNWTNWATAPLTVLPGTNVIQAVALDSSNNLSLTNTVKFQRK